MLVRLAMGFFEEFNNLFGYDWWGTGTADKEPEKEHGETNKYQKDDELEALIEDVLFLTEPPPTKEVRYEEHKSHHPPSPLSHPQPSPQLQTTAPHPWQNHQVPVQNQYPPLQGQVPHNPTATIQDNQPIPPSTPYHPPPHPYYYNPYNYMYARQVSQEMPPPTQAQDAEDSQPQARSYSSDDGLSRDQAMKTNSEPLPPLPSPVQNHFFPPPPPPSFYNIPPPPRVFLDSSPDPFMSQAPIGPQQVRARSHEDLLSARTHEAVEDGEITLQTMLEEKLAADAELIESVANEEDLDEEAVHNLEAGRPSPYFFPPLARMNSEDDRHGYPLEEDYLDRDGTIPKVFMAQGHLEYLSLSSSNKSPFPEDASLDLLKEFLDTEDEAEDEEDDTISELDETMMCQTPEGLIGSCSTPTECSMVSGLPSGPCSVPSVKGHLTCCLHSAHCGHQSAQLVTYIHNQDYPSPTSTLPSCPISIALLPDICQVRLDFLHLSLPPPVSGSCDPSNSLTLSTTPGGSVSPHTLCDYIGGTADPLTPDIPHLYAHYNLSHSPSPHPFHQLNLNMAVNFPSTWNIRVAQIRCDLDSSILAPLMAASTCSQWYTSPSGIMDSVNLLSGSTKQFKACIKPDPAACAIKYHFYSVVCNMEDQVQIIGSNVTMCGVTEDEWEVVVPVGGDMGVVVTPGKKQDGGASSFTVGYTLLYDCTGLLGQN